jgi:deazaflavin-dependent oxidoreductase (nitroreductase family)
MILTAYRRILVTLGPHAWFTVFVDRVVTPTERVLYRLTGGRIAVAHVGRHAAVPELMLITRGRKSGRERRAPVLYLEDDGRLFVVGSNFGRERHPAWSENLLAEPAAEVIVNAQRRPVRARRADEDDFRRMWPRMLEIWPAWATYRTRTDREFRAFFLEPA